MTEDKEASAPANNDPALAPRTEDGPAESEVARGNVHSHGNEEPDLPAPPPQPH